MKNKGSIIFRLITIVFFISILLILNLAQFKFIQDFRTFISTLKFSKSNNKSISKYRLFSNVNKYNVIISSDEFINFKLDELDFWNENKIMYYKPSGFAQKRITVKKLDIVFTDKVQSLGQEVVLVEGKEYIDSAFGMEYNTVNQQLILSIYLHPQSIETMSLDRLAGRLSFKILATLFEITHPYLQSHKDFRERYRGLDEFTSTLGKLPNRSFLVVTKSL